MLDKQTIETVKSTAPVIKENIHDIGGVFYRNLFDRVPDLYNMFNQTNQKLGYQQEALAYGVYLAGVNIDDFGPIEPMIKRVTEKHRALGVQPEQYQVVGEALLDAVKEVLGDAATDDIMDAWGRAYEYIADAFISIEKELYEEEEQETGGWVGNRTFYVDQKVQESDVITSFYLKPADNKPIETFEAGQYLTLQADVPDERYYHMRHYSLSDAPGKDYYRISVKREDSTADIPGGIVSNYLHHDISEGDTLQVAAPAGDFTIKSESKPIVLLSGGVGITPMMSMLNTLAETEPEREVTFIHAAQNSTVHAMRDHVRQLTEQHANFASYFVYDKPTPEDKANKLFDQEGYIDLPWLQEILADNEKDFYFCGPMPFLKAINAALKEWGVPYDNRTYELFSPMSTIEE